MEKQNTNTSGEAGTGDSAHEQKNLVDTRLRLQNLSSYIRLLESRSRTGIGREPDSEPKNEGSQKSEPLH